MGGMGLLLELMVTHENDDLRKKAAMVFNTMTSNNDKVQKFANAYRANNLVIQLEREEKPEMRELILGSLLACLKANNFPGKIDFITHFQGLSRVSHQLILHSENTNPAKTGEGKLNAKIK
jgi:hypothetical protein